MVVPKTHVPRLMIRSVLPLLSLLVAFLPAIPVVHGFGVPGTSQTLSGYDTEGGTDPVCWLGRSDPAVFSGVIYYNTTDKYLQTNEDEQVKATPWDNKLYKSFVLTGQVELLPECPAGVTIDGDAPAELTERGEVMRTGRYYDYAVRGSIDLDRLAGEYVFSDDGPRIAVQVILCEVAVTGFCSPFVHEHANDRLIATNSTVKMETGDRHGDTHVHAPTVFVDLPEAAAGGVQHFEVTVPLRVNAPGFFFGIAAFQVFTTTEEQEGAFQYKYDVANALGTRLITYQDPPQILTVTKGMEIVAAILIAVSVAVLCGVLFQTVKYRGHSALKLSQVPFLIAFLMAAIVATLCTFLFNPKSDLYCQLRAPLVLIPLQFMYAITIGRLWRINQVISPLLMIKADVGKKQSCSSTACRKFFDALTSISMIGHHITCRCRGGKRGSISIRGSVRSKVTELQLAKVVLVFTLPQIILQICNLVLQPSRMVVDYNIDESIGIATCDAQSRAATSLDMWGWYLLILLFVLILFLAFECRALPSLFNETQEIYNSILISILAIAIGLVTIRLSDSPTTSPDVAYFVRVLIVLVMTLNAALRKMLPKLFLARSGKPVLINKLVTDHRIASQRSIGNRSTNAPSYTSTNSAASYTDRQKSSNTSARIHSSQASEIKVSSEIEEPASSRKIDNGGPPSVRFTDEEAQAPPAPPSSKEHNGDHKHDDSSSRRHRSKRIRIDDNHAPSRSLILKMMEVQSSLANANQSINSGYCAITHEEWADLREACVELGSVFRDDVRFEWEEKNEDAKE